MADVSAPSSCTFLMMKLVWVGLVVAVMATGCINDALQNDFDDVEKPTPSREPVIIGRVGDDDAPPPTFLSDLCGANPDVQAYEGEVMPAVGPDGSFFCLGAVLLQGELESVEAVPTENGDGGTLNPVFTQAGIDAFNNAALKCFSRAPDCPTGRLAIVLNGTVASAPTIQTAVFERDQIVISGDFTLPEAEEISAQLSHDASAISFQPVIAEVFG